MSSPHPGVLALDAVNLETGEVIAELGESLTDDLIKKLRKENVQRVHVFVPSGRAESMLITSPGSQVIVTWMGRQQTAQSSVVT